VGVNVGVIRAAEWLQSSLNLLNRGKRSDIKVDGGIGPTTLRELQECIKTNPIKRLMNVFSVHQGEHYKGIMERDASQKRYVGWFDRVGF